MRCLIWVVAIVLATALSFVSPRAMSLKDAQNGANCCPISHRATSTHTPLDQHQQERLRNGSDSAALSTRISDYFAPFLHCTSPASGATITRVQAHIQRVATFRHEPRYVSIFVLLI